MAQDIFSGSNLKVQISNTAGSTVSTTFTELDELAAFATSGGTSTVIDVKTFSSTYNRKLVGTKSVADITLTVNWIPDSVSQLMLQTASDNQTRIQVKISYFENATETSGYFVVYNGFISSDKVAGDKDSVVTKEFVLSVDGAPVSQGVLTA
ncbi:phage tail tube protein [Rouxiella sp. T17]|uniref:phage tail tube protein n=1 Tax=Rouxiella sp. T17 TaxID=3085684 RepID=UPI002FC61770